MLLSTLDSMLIFPDLYRWVENSNRQKPWGGFIPSGVFAAGTQTGLFFCVLFLKLQQNRLETTILLRKKSTLFFSQIKPCGVELAPGGG